MSEQKELDILLKDELVPEEEQPYEIPKNWVWTRMGKVTKVNPAKMNTELISDDQKCSFLPMSAVNEVNGTIDYLEERNFSKVKKGYTNFLEGDILFAKITPCMENGKSTIAENLLSGFGYGSTEFYVLRPTTAVDRRYVYYLIRDKAFREKAKEVMTGAVGHQRVPKKYLENYQFPLPPYNEQKRIVKKIESMFSKIEEAWELIGDARETFKNRKTSILVKAFKGELTKTWREENLEVDSIEVLIEEIKLKMGKKQIKYNLSEKLPKGWAFIKLKDLVNTMGGGTPLRSNDEYWGGDIPWVSPKDMKEDYIYDTMDKVTEKGVQESSTKIGRAGSVVMVARSGILKHTLPVAILKSDSAINQDLKIMDSGNGDLNEYIFWYIKGHQTNLLDSYVKSGTTVQSIKVKEFFQHNIPVPPLEEMRKILELVRSLIAKEMEIEELTQFEEQIDLLKKTILAKAFRGKLGTNDSSEESAKELLKQILKNNGCIINVVKKKLSVK